MTHCSAALDQLVGGLQVPSASHGLSPTSYSRRESGHRLGYRRLGKRLLDIVISSIGLIVLAPVIALTSVLVQYKLGAPVLFRQPRPGLHAKPFRLLKLRTMTNARDGEGRLLPDGLRLPPIGRLLRSLSLDELPELLNVLRGEMSIVGPRPLLMQYLDRYSPEQMRRHEVRPGITGWAQVNGRNALSWERRFELDVWYVDHCSLLLDLRIIALTIWRVLDREGISEPGQATMTEFLGSERE